MAVPYTFGTATQALPLSELDDNFAYCTTLVDQFAVNVNVSAYATSGSGTTGSPWTGWDTAITWTEGVAYNFPPGVYSYTSAPSGWNQDNMILKGTPDTVLRCTGAGPVMYFDAGTSGTVGKTNLDIGPFILEGNGTTTQKGLWLRSVNRSKFDRIRVRGVTQYGIHQNFGVLNEFYMPVISGNMDSGYYMPSVHMSIDAVQASGYGDYYSAATNIYSPILEHNSTGIGLQLIHKAVGTQVFGGTSEGMSTGLEIGNDATGDKCERNSFFNFDLEANTTYDNYVKAAFNTNYYNCCFFSNVTNNNYIASGATFTKFIGGQTIGYIYDAGQGTQFDDHSFTASNYTFALGVDTQWNRCRDFALNKTWNFNPPVIQYTSSVTGTITVATGVEVLILDGALAGTLTVALPAYVDLAGGGALNPQIFKVCCTGAITTITFTDPKGRTVPANVSATAGSSFTYYYGQAGFKWIRIG